MATRTLTYRQITKASRLLDLDPDCYPSGVLEKVLWNRKAREAKTENLRHRFEGMADAYENAIELAEVAGGDFDSL